MTSGELLDRKWRAQMTLCVELVLMPCNFCENFKSIGPVVFEIRDDLWKFSMTSGVDELGGRALKNYTLREECKSYLLWKFQVDTSISFWVIVPVNKQTDKQTNKQTNATDQHTCRNAISASNKQTEQTNILAKIVDFRQVIKERSDIRFDAVGWKSLSRRVLGTLFRVNRTNIKQIRAFFVILVHFNILGLGLGLAYIEI